MDDLRVYDRALSSEEISSLFNEADTTTLTWSPQAGYGYDGVDPNQGQPGTDFYFRVVYTSGGNLPPADGYPRLLLDANGDGDVDDPDDQIVPLDPADADGDYTDGREYLGPMVLDADQTSYRYRFEAVDTEGAVAGGEPAQWQDGPVVDSYLYDLAIYADDIQFSSPNPDVGEDFNVTVSFANNSLAAATNVMVVLEQEGGAAIDSTVVAQVDSWTEGEVTFTHSFDALGFYPLRARISSPDIAEWNLLNNDAARPILVGDFAIPGAIAINGLPGSVSVHPAARFSFGGGAVYTGTALSTSPPVQGGTVIYRPSWGGEFLTHTNDSGSFAQYLNAPATPGTYQVEIEVTDFTLTTHGTVTIYVTAPPVVQPRANLRIVVSASPTQLCAGGDVEMSWRVSNTGDLASAATTAVLKFDGAVLLDAPIGPLAPGEAVDLPAASVANVTVGGHTVSGRVDPANLVLESTEYDNAATVPLRAWSTCSELDPDYVHGPSTVCPGSSTTVWINVYNWGCYDSEATEVAVLVDGLEVTRHFLGAIAGRNHSRYIGFTRSFAESGAHTITFRVDPDNRVDECNESNNEVSRVVTVVDCPTYPDYVVDSCDLSVTNAAPANGERIGFKARVRNASGTDGTTRLIARFSLDNTPDWESVHDLGFLSAGQEVVVTSDAWAVVFNPDRLRVTLDPDGLEDEANEGNNTATAVLPSELHPVHIPVCPGYGTAMFSDCSPCPGDAITIRGAVINDGLLSVDNAEVVYSGTAGGLESPVILPVTNLRYLGQCSDDLHWTSISHAFTALGQHTVDFTVDPANVWPEYDESNNTFSGSLTVYDCTQPDLYIWSEHINPSELNPDFNTTIDSVAVTIFNGGNEGAQDVEVRLAVDETQLGGLAVIDSIPGGSYRSVQWTDPWVVPEGLPSIHVIQACADPQNLIAESNEENNCATRSIVAGAAPDLFLTVEDIIVSVDEEPANPGDPLGLAVCVKNRGGVAAAGLLVIEYEDPVTGLVTLATRPVFVEEAGADYGRQWVNASWTLPAENTWVHFTIVSVMPEEFDVTNNHVKLLIPDDSVVATVVSSFTVESEASGVRLQWKALNEFTGFHLERRQDGSFDWQRVTTVPVVAAAAAGYAVYSYDDAGVDSGSYTYRLLGLRQDGSLVDLAFANVDHAHVLPREVALSNNYPNPFNPQTSLELSLPRAQRVDVGIYDVRGRLVRKLVAGQMSAGTHTLTWRGETENGGHAASGVYFCRMRTDERTQTVKLMMVK